MSGSGPAEDDDEGGVGSLLLPYTRRDLEVSVLLAHDRQWTECSLRFVDLLHFKLLCFA